MVGEATLVIVPETVSSRDDDSPSGALRAPSGSSSSLEDTVSRVNTGSGHSDHSVFNSGGLYSREISYFPPFMKGGILFSTRHVVQAPSQVHSFAKYNDSQMKLAAKLRMGTSFGHRLFSFAKCIDS